KGADPRTSVCGQPAAISAKTRRAKAARNAVQGIGFHLLRNSSRANPISRAPDLFRAATRVVGFFRLAIAISPIAAAALNGGSRLCRTRWGGLHAWGGASEPAGGGC